jgi:archaeal flagellar protein FlaJ
MFMIAKNYLGWWGEMLRYAGNDADPFKFSSILAIVALVAGIAASSVVGGTLTARYIVWIGAFLATHIIAYAYLLLASNSRAAKVEEVLPDFLSLVASNIRSGLTTDRALITSARDEFGPLTVAINKAGKSSITGMPLEHVMTQLCEYINSDVLRKTMRLIVEGMQSGGDMSELMEKTALDIRKFRSVRREIDSIILNYKLFILAAIALGAPLLYAVSTFLVDIMIAIKGKIAANAVGSAESALQVGLFKGKLMLSSEAITFFAAVSIIVTVFFGCMAVGVMGSGRRMEGLKYFPLLALVGIVVLFGIRLALGTILKGMMGT